MSVSHPVEVVLRQEVKTCLFLLLLNFGRCLLVTCTGFHRWRSECFLSEVYSESDNLNCSCLDPGRMSLRFDSSLRVVYEVLVVENN